MVPQQPPVEETEHVGEEVVMCCRYMPVSRLGSASVNMKRLVPQYMGEILQWAEPVLAVAAESVRLEEAVQFVPQVY